VDTDQKGAVMYERLTPEGREYAETHLQSIVARVALQGYTGEWPKPFVDTSIEVMNEDGSNRDVPPFDNDPRTDAEIKQEVYDRLSDPDYDDDHPNDWEE
jgi:hypothetical protein